MDPTPKRRSLLVMEKNAAYEYLCRLEEAKKWMESIIGEELPPSTELEENLCNGVVLCKLGMKLFPDDPQWKRIYDIDQRKYASKGLDFRHTDNINFFLNFLSWLGLPKIFYPGVTDIFERKNPVKLIYCLHALSHMLRHQGKTQMAVNEFAAITPKFTEDDLSQASKTLKSGDVPSFEVVEKLVEEELQYTKIDIYNSEVVEEEDIVKSSDHLAFPDQGHVNGDKEVAEKEDDDSLFDDPKYILISGTGEPLLNNSEETCTVYKTTHLKPLLRNLKCHGAGIFATLYPSSSEGAGKGTNEFQHVLRHINQSVDVGSPLETLRALQKTDGNLPFPYLEAEDYQLALDQEKEEGLPKNTIVIYSGLQRSLCDTLLDKMRAGAYLLRQSTNLTNEDFVFSFKNHIGIKHWKLGITTHGKVTWGAANKHFDTLESFILYFVEALEKVTKLYIYPGTSFMLKLNTSILTTEQSQVLEEQKKLDRNLTYGQLAFVINDVNSRIRRQRATSREKVHQSSQQHQISQLIKKQDGPVIPTDPMVQLNLEMLDEDPWNESLMIKVNRIEAEDLLDREGYPGSFLVRPSERVSGDYALAFRTRTEIRHWKIVKKDDNYYVHPRPNPYPSVHGIVQHFRDAVGAETGLVMTPLIPKGMDKSPSPQGSPKTSPKGSNIDTLGHMYDPHTEFPEPHDCARFTSSESVLTPPIPPPRGKGIVRNTRESLKKDAIVPTPSLSRLNPANITSWSTNDVTQWLIEQGLGQFVDVFQENCVDGECLLTLDNNLLKDDLGISQLGYRSRILKRVQILKQTLHPEIATGNN